MLSKEQLFGYLLLAGNKLKLSDKEIRELIYTLEEEFEIWTEEYAEKIFDKWIGKWSV